MKTAMVVLTAIAIGLGVLSAVVTDPWHRHAALTMSAIVAMFAAFAGLVLWLEPKSSAGAGASRPPHPAPAGHHRRRR